MQMAPISQEIGVPNCAKDEIVPVEFGTHIQTQISELLFTMKTFLCSLTNGSDALGTEVC